MENRTIKSPEYDKNAVTEGFAFGSYRTYSPAVGLNHTQNLGEKKDFEGYLNVINAIKKENQYLMLALLDYKQVPFYINRNKNETHLVSLKPMEERVYSFKLDNLSAGSHDLIFLLFLNPYEHSLNERFRYSTDFSMMGSRRFNIIVGNGSAVFPEFKKFEFFAKPDYPLEGILVNKEPCSARSWLVENPGKNETLEYYINLGSDEKWNQRTCAIVQFLDYKQIPIQYKSSEYVYYGYLNNGEKGSIPASLITPDKEGVHELIIVWVSDPFENIGISPGIRNINLEDRVEPSIRIGLNVKDKR